MIWKYAGILALAAALVGCGNQQEPQVKTYDNDGYLGFTNTNPNLQTSPTYHNRNADIDMVEKTVQDLEHVKSSRVIFNGPNAYITLNIPKNLSRKSKENLRADAYEALQMMLPRYIVTVKLVEQ